MNLTRLKFEKSASFLLGFIFLVAAASKGMDLVRFSREIELLLVYIGFPQSSPILNVSFYIAVGVVLLEFGCGLGLIIRFKTRIITILTIILLSIFLLINSFGLITGKLEFCGCFGLLFERNLIASLIENSFLLGLALYILTKKSSENKNLRLFSILYVISIIWLVIFFVIPPGFTALREGRVWEYEISGFEFNKKDNLAIWFMDPSCEECLNKFPIINQFPQSGYSVIALTDASEGRVNEFRFDYEPKFPIFNIDTKDIMQMGVISGSLIHCRNGKIQKILQLRKINNQLSLIND